MCLNKRIHFLTVDVQTLDLKYQKKNITHTVIFVSEFSQTVGGI